MNTPRSANERRFATVADNLAGITDPSMGDERERDIILRAGTTAMTASIFTIQLLGVYLAVIGVGLWSSVVLIAAVIPSLVYSWYCKSAGLDTTRSYSKVAPRRRRLAILAGIVVACAWIGAIAFHTLTGAPLIDVGIGALANGDSETASGLITGGIAGGAIAVVALALTVRVGRKRLAADEAADDED